MVVGARCAGAPLATLLARHGVDVAVVEKATFPRDTLSTHVFEADALAFLDRLGLTEQLLESDLEAHFMDHASSCEPVAAAMTGARRVGKLLGMVRWQSFFREASGPGWVLTGDAGHFKDPAPGRGIGDAFMQADQLAPIVASVLNGPDKPADDAMSRWGRWRDKEFAEYYWVANNLGAAGPLPAALPEILRRLHVQGRASLALETTASSHRSS